MMPLFCALALTSHSDAIRLYENAWAPFEQMEIKYRTVELSPNQNNMIYTADYKAARNGIKNTVNVNQIARSITIWIFRDKVIRRTNTEDSIIQLEKNKLYVAFDARQEIMKCFLGHENQLNSLTELENAGMVNVQDRPGNYEIKYHTDIATNVLIVDKLHNGMVSNLETTILQPSSVGGIVKKKVTEWIEPEPGYFFPKTIHSEYADKSGVIQYRRETQIQLLSYGNKVTNIDEWKHAPNTMVFDKIQKLQYKTDNYGKPLKQEKLAELPKMINTDLVSEQSPLWKSLWFWVVTILILMLLIRIIYRRYHVV